MLPKVLCFLAIVAAVAAAPYSDFQYTDQLQKDYDDDKYVDTTEDYGKFEDTQQFQEKDKENAEFKDIEQLEPEIDEQEENIEQTDRDMEGIEQSQQDSEDDLQETEQIDQDNGSQASKIEQFEQQDDDWNQNEDNVDNAEDDTIHFEDDMDGLEKDSAIEKLFGDSTVQEQEEKYGDDQYQQKSEDDQLPVEETVPGPSYNSNYESGHSGIYRPSDPFEPEVYTVKLPWYKRYWAKTKETAKGAYHKVKDAFGKK